MQVLRDACMLRSLVPASDINELGKRVNQCLADYDRSLSYIPRSIIKTEIPYIVKA
jgi:hypothetical protein